MKCCVDGLDFERLYGFWCSGSGLASSSSSFYDLSLSRLSADFYVYTFVSITHVKDYLLKIICLSFLMVFYSIGNRPWDLEFDRREWAPRGTWYKVYTNAFACSLLSLSDSIDGSGSVIFCHRFAVLVSHSFLDLELYVSFIQWIGFAVF